MIYRTQPIPHLLLLLLITLSLLLAPAHTGWSQDAADEPAPAEEQTAAETEPEESADAKITRVADDARRDVTDAGRELARGNILGAMPLIEKYVLPVISALLILLVAYFLGKILGRAASGPIKKRIDPSLGSFISKVIFWSIMIAALLSVLGMFGVNIATFAAVVAAAGFAIGLAFQGTLSNFAAGVLLLAIRPFRVGDFVNVAGISAKVTEIDLFYTIFDTFDNRRIIVPNSDISSSTIENITYHPERRVDVEVGTDYTADLKQTREVLSQAAESLKEHMVEGEGRGYAVVLGDLGDSAIGWSVRFWAKTDDWLEVKQKLTEAVKNHLDAAGIGIPYPQMDVHLQKDD
jgi:small conductance mechanosensitive channel